MKNKIKIYYYALCCPITQNMKYIGRTVDIKNRFRNHIYEAKKRNRNKRERWITSLLKQNLLPVMRILWSGYMMIEDAIRIEKKLISIYRKSFDLKNESDHGLGGKISTKYVYQYSIDGIFINSFLNSNQASINTGINDANILRCCHSKRAISAGGFLWSFKKYEIFPKQYNTNWRKDKGKPVVKIDIFGNETIYKTARVASQETGVSYKKISSCCLGNQNTAGGFVWNFYRI